ncbi:uncharacterized protein LOC118356186 [Zalophus californianus]|uniref:Uncharacterized protein LOC118356186 n=1 Tax=Zalophus californianus TaxID=9704 RepID=A0A6P9EX78_ZALCA|nr:uncharacterized protein LOC118356186 [Zalophus californianus]
MLSSGRSAEAALRTGCPHVGNDSRTEGGEHEPTGLATSPCPAAPDSSRPGIPPLSPRSPHQTVSCPPAGRIGPRRPRAPTTRPHDAPRARRPRLAASVVPLASAAPPRGLRSSGSGACSAGGSRSRMAFLRLSVSPRSQKPATRELEWLQPETHHSVPLQETLTQEHSWWTASCQGPSFDRPTEASVLQLPCPPAAPSHRLTKAGGRSQLMCAHLWTFSTRKPSLTRTFPGCPAGWLFSNQPSLLPLLCPEGPAPSLYPSSVFPPINSCS